MREVKLNDSGRTRKYGRIIVRSVEPSRFKKDRNTATCEQEVIDVYPGGRPNNSLFEVTEFGFESQEFKNTRVVFLDVPLKATKERVQEILDRNPNACIYRTMSLIPIINDDQGVMISRGVLSLETLASRQTVKTPKLDGNNQPVKDAKGETIMEIIPWKDAQGKVLADKFYRVNSFSPTHVDDVDLRPTEHAVLSGSTVAENTAVAK